MNITSCLIFTAIGAGAGWLAAAVMKSGEGGVLGNILIGSIGGLVSGFLFSSPTVGGDLIGSMAMAAVGAGSLLYGVGRFGNSKGSSIYFKGDELWIRRKPSNRR